MACYERGQYGNRDMGERERRGGGGGGEREREERKRFSGQFTPKVPLKGRGSIIINSNLLKL